MEMLPRREETELWALLPLGADNAGRLHASGVTPGLGTWISRGLADIIPLGTCRTLKLLGHVKFPFLFPRLHCFHATVRLGGVPRASWSDGASAVKAHTPQSRPSPVTLASWSSPSFPRSTQTREGTRARYGVWSRDGPLPLGWGAVAVIVGIITLFIISSAVSIVVVLEYNRSTDTFRGVSRKERSAFSESLLSQLACNYISNCSVKKNSRVPSVKTMEWEPSKAKSKEKRVKTVRIHIFSTLEIELKACRDLRGIFLMAESWYKQWASWCFKLSYPHPSLPAL